MVSLTLKFNGDTAANVVPLAGLSDVTEAYTSRFDLNWIPNNVTLNIFTVRTGDEGVFGCELLVQTTGGSSKTWKRNIEVTVVGKLITIIIIILPSFSSRRAS